MKSRLRTFRRPSTAAGSVASFACALILDRLRTVARLAAAVRGRPTEKAVHDARVACRRAQEAMAFFDGVDRVPPLPDVDRAARRLAKAVGTMRETAVAIRAIEALGPASRSAEIERARRAVLAGLRHRKRSIGFTRRKRIAKRALKLERAIADAAPALAEREADTRSPALTRFLALRISARTAKVVRHVRRLAPHQKRHEPPYAKLHRVRVAIKRWRYTEEIAFFATPNDRARRDLLLTLRRLQDAGGKTQDLADLVKTVRKELRTLRPADAAGGPALLAQIRHSRARAATAFVRMIGEHLGPRRQKS
jgi:CHAD domain-containing protein